MGYNTKIKRDVVADVLHRPNTKWNKIQTTRKQTNLQENITEITQFGETTVKCTNASELVSEIHAYRLN